MRYADTQIHTIPGCAPFATMTWWHSGEGARLQLAHPAPNVTSHTSHSGRPPLSRASSHAALTVRMRAMFDTTQQDTVSNPTMSTGEIQPVQAWHPPQPALPKCESEQCPTGSVVSTSCGSRQPNSGRRASQQTFATTSQIFTNLFQEIDILVLLLCLEGASF